MTRFLTTFAHTDLAPSRSLVMRAFLITALPLLSLLKISATSAEDTAPSTETSLVTQQPSEVSDRESRLRDIEDELLKQLSMGATPSAHEATPTSLPDIKHVATTDSPAPQPTPTVSPIPSKPIRQSPAPMRTAAPSSGNRPRVVAASLPQPSTTDEVRIPDGRSPQAATVVAVTAKQVPHRTPKIKRSTDSTQLSAKDLEHRLAIAESQVTLLTKELETTKAKLAQSETKALTLTQQSADSSSNSITQAVDQESSNFQQTTALGADETDAMDTRADSYATVARVTKDNAPLRIGPGTRESTIFRISRNATVKIEHRTGEWYRVITADGSRGWINGSALMFDEGKRPGSTVQVRAFETRFETMDLKY